MACNRERSDVRNEYHVLRHHAVCPRVIGTNNPWHASDRKMPFAEQQTPELGCAFLKAIKMQRAILATSRASQCSHVGPSKCTRAGHPPPLLCPHVHHARLQKKQVQSNLRQLSSVPTCKEAKRKLASAHHWRQYKLVRWKRSSRWRERQCGR
jgi:hypothetical protein